MCLALPGKIVAISDRSAVVEYPGQTRQVLLSDDVKIKLNDYVMVQMGVVIKKVSAQEAKHSLRAWESITNK